MVLVVIPFIMLIGLKLRPRIWTQFGHRHRAERAVNSQVNDNLTGARVVKAFGQENRETSRFEKNNLRLRDAEMSIVGTRNLVSGSYSGIFEILNIFPESCLGLLINRFIRPQAAYHCIVWTDGTMPVHKARQQLFTL